jgi:hypothetical protein
MGQTAEYFKRERYITRRLSLLVLTGTAILVPVALSVWKGQLAPAALPWALAGVVLGVAVAVVFIVRAANLKFPRSSTPDGLPLDKVSRRKLRRRVLLLEAFVAIYAFFLLSGLAHAHRGAWPGVLGAAVLILVMEFALVKAIRRLKSKLKEGTVVEIGRAAE